MRYQFDFSFLWDPEGGYLDDLLHGAWLTVQLSGCAVVLGFLVGTAAAVARTGRVAWLRRLVAVYVEVIRNTPLLVQTFWLFFGLAGIGIRLPAAVAAVMALTLNVGAYSAEIIRAGIESIHRGQVEAGESLGLGRAQLLFDVVLPPAVEKVLPALISQFVLMMLASSIMAQISAEELMAAAGRIQSETFRGFEVYIVVAVAYLLLAQALRGVLRLAGWLAFPRRRRTGRPARRALWQRA